MYKEEKVFNIVEYLFKNILDLDELKIDDVKKELIFIENEKRRNIYTCIKYNIETLKNFKEEKINEQINNNGRITYNNTKNLIDNILKKDKELVRNFYRDYKIIYKKEFEELIKNFNEVKEYFE